MSSERRLKFIADADFNEKISDGVRLREPAVDFLSATDGLGLVAYPTDECWNSLPQ